jgi:hypothetical protein
VRRSCEKVSEARGNQVSTQTRRYVGKELRKENRRGTGCKERDSVGGAAVSVQTQSYQPNGQASRLTVQENFRQREGEVHVGSRGSCLDVAIASRDLAGLPSLPATPLAPCSIHMTVETRFPVTVGTSVLPISAPRQMMNVGGLAEGEQGRGPVAPANSSKLEQRGNQVSTGNSWCHEAGNTKGSAGGVRQGRVRLVKGSSLLPPVISNGPRKRGNQVSTDPNACDRKHSETTLEDGMEERKIHLCKARGSFTPSGSQDHNRCGNQVSTHLWRGHFISSSSGLDNDRARCSGGPGPVSPARTRSASDVHEMCGNQVSIRSRTDDEQKLATRERRSGAGRRTVQRMVCDGPSSAVVTMPCSHAPTASSVRRNFQHG